MTILFGSGSQVGAHALQEQCGGASVSIYG